ncbi:probable cytochrome P450 CYP44 [Amphibalanus amphitrite]|uniref:probable cytochrome P450 CYP44 n=1 Tax=Amphibalanus amphitrite TaxID=1232801 RepID=UPI001C90ADC7|nr:probable cytochrome P450 CYP44 [Amphibalanus amphitrite]
MSGGSVSLQVLARGRPLLLGRDSACCRVIRGSATAASPEERAAAVLPFSAIPGPRRLPGIGSLWLYKTGRYDMARYHEVLQSMYHQYGPVVREDFGPDTVIHVFDSDMAKQVHQKDGKYPHVPPLQEAVRLYREKNGMSPGLGNSNGERWYRLRSAVQQLMMRPREVSCFLPLADTAARALAHRVDSDVTADGQLTDLTQLVFKWALESASMVCAERPLGALAGGDAERRAEELIAANRRVMRASAQLKFSSLPLYKYISTPSWRRLVAAENCLTSFTLNLFNDTIKEVESLVSRGRLEEGQYRFLSFMLALPNVSEDDTLIIAFSMFNDGLSTTVPALLMALWCLANTPEAQHTLYHEIRSALPEGSQQPVTAEVVNNIPFMKAVLKETLRLYPIGTEVSRITDKDMELGGYHIPAGTHVDLNQWVQLRSEDSFPEPTTFRPERWLRQNRQQIDPYLHIPFGHGTRMCAGRRFAEQDFCLALVRLLQRFELLPADGHRQPPRQLYETLLMPDPPVQIRFVRRR